MLNPCAGDLRLNEWATPSRGRSKPESVSICALNLGDNLADTRGVNVVAARQERDELASTAPIDLSALDLEFENFPNLTVGLALKGAGQPGVEMPFADRTPSRRSNESPMNGLTIRDMGFVYPRDFDPRWNPRVPEFAMVANAVSLLMPHAEPYVVSSSRAALAHIGDDPLDPTKLADRTRAYIRQEAQHHAEHRKFNSVVARRYRTKLLERMMAATFRFLKGRSSSFGIAFAAGFETVAFVVARWVDARMHTLLPEIGKLGANGVPSNDDSNVAANLFVWHLAEEAEHRSIAYEVHQRTGGTQLAYTAAMIVSFVILGIFTSLGILTMLTRDRRILHPMAWFRLIGWTLSFLFNAVPLMAVTCLSGHEPADLLDPPNLMAWLRSHDGNNRA
jgi:uncharacterized protein